MNDQNVNLLSPLAAAFNADAVDAFWKLIRVCYKKKLWTKKGKPGKGIVRIAAGVDEDELIELDDDDDVAAFDDNALALAFIEPDDDDDDDDWAAAVVDVDDACDVSKFTANK